MDGATRQRELRLLARKAELEEELARKARVLLRLLPASPAATTTDSTAATTTPTTSSAARPRRFRGAGAGQKPAVSRQHEFDMPRDIAENPQLDEAIERTLPKNYNFEIKKTLWRIRRVSATRVAIQLPEGLLLFACTIGDLLEKFAKVEVFILADVTYGACCVDDFAARALGCELLVHYGHSCLVPVDVTSVAPAQTRPQANTTSTKPVQVMYVFVDVSFDMHHMAECIKLEFPDPKSKLALLGTIQFSGSLHAAKTELDKYYVEHPLLVPQIKPLSGGEVLGCTSPNLPPDLDGFVFVADGRFHLESAMIANPQLRAHRYDPYAKVLTTEAYDSAKLLEVRSADIARARRATRWGVILGTLGRQGNPAILRRVVKAIRDQRGLECVVVLLSEITAGKLKELEANQIEAWVQIACPRLSIDWAGAFSEKPLLTPYELFVTMGLTPWRGETYPQDFYSKGSGPWTNYYEEAGEGV